MSTQTTEPSWAAIHDERWPWCPLHVTHEHEDRADGTYVNGEKAGPMWELPRSVVIAAHTEDGR